MPWQPTQFAGIEMKILYSDDEGRSTILFKMAPGAVVPLHEHTALEQTYMLEGSLEDAEGACGAGDFVWRPGGNIHVAHAPHGATFLAIFNRPNRSSTGRSSSRRKSSAREASRDEILRRATLPDRSHALTTETPQSDAARKWGLIGVWAISCERLPSGKILSTSTRAVGGRAR
jgi:quercetin dioxygenase-like cupin family protein